MAINAVINVFYAQTDQTAQANPSRHSPIGTTAFHRGSFRPSVTCPWDHTLKYDSKNKAYGFENF